jgi:hypothetical protein
MTDIEWENAREEAVCKVRNLRGYCRRGLFRYFFRDLWWLLSCWCPRPYWCLEDDGKWCAFDKRKDAERELLDFHKDGCCWPKKKGYSQEPDCAPIPAGQVCGLMTVSVKWMTPLRLASYGEFDGW